MKKNKSKIGENISMGLMLTLMIIGLFVVIIWSCKGITNIVRTYNQVNELSGKIFWLEEDIKEITKKLCSGYTNPILRNGKCLHGGFGVGNIITNPASSTTQLSDCLPVVGCSKATLIK